jgi:hypothetical protein
MARDPLNTLKYLIGQDFRNGFDNENERIMDINLEFKQILDDLNFHR